MFGLLWVLYQLRLPVPGPVRALTAGAWPAVLGHLVLAFPSGRLRTLPARVTAALGYLCVAVFALADGTAAVGAGGAALVLVGLAVLVLQAGRLRRGSAAERRALLPVLAAAVAASALFVVWKPMTIAGLGTPPLTVAVHLALAAVPVAYLWGLLRRRIDRGAVADLVVRLGDRDRPAALQPALAAVLHDPALRVGYWTSGGYVDADGRPFHPPDAPGQVLTRVDRDGPLAVLAHDRVLLADPELIEAACAAAALALANARLTAELRARLRQLADSRAQVLRAAEAERRRLERDLHDGVQQRLLSIPLTLGLAEASLSSRPERVAPLIGEAKSTTLAVLAEVRALTQGLHPPVLTERGLRGAVRELAAVAPVPLELGLEGADGLPADVETTAYYVVAEALANLAKHAGATRGRVVVRRDGATVAVEVEDDGRGGADLAGGSGLSGLAERVGDGGGRLSVHSPPGGGTRIRAELPCGS
ncbi:sensor histidine kinase [Nonomuraea longicatena]|uniref:histidine kinase n=1 Tax=Nonomuraea longicatena TaxID=83682 RepID=A0ABP3ZCT1_9ACTN